MQLDLLKDRATASQAESLQRARDAAARGGRPDDAEGGESHEALRSRLEAAVQAMQEGLVERDVEVGLKFICG